MQWPNRTKRNAFTLLELTLSFSMLAIVATLLLSLIAGREKLHSQTSRRLADRIALENLAVQLRDESFQSLPDAVNRLRQMAEQDQITITVSDSNEQPKVRHLKLSKRSQTVHLWRVAVEATP